MQLIRRKLMAESKRDHPQIYRIHTDYETGRNRLLVF